MMSWYRRIGRRFFPLAAASALLLAAILPAVAGHAASAQTVQPGAWSTPVQLSNGTDFAWFPDLVADPAGHLHAVFAAYKPEFDVVAYTRSLDGGLTWSRPNDVQAIAVINRSQQRTRPALMMQSNGMLNLSFRGYTVYYSRAPVGQAIDANAWSKPYAISTRYLGYASSLAENEQGAIQLVYTENVPTERRPISYHLFYRSSTDGGRVWKAPKDLTAEIKGVAKPQILIDRLGDLHVVFEAGEGGYEGQLFENIQSGVAIISSFDNGQTWTEPLQLNLTGEEARNIAIGMDGAGRLVVVWQSLRENRILFRVSTDNGKDWSAPQVIPGAWGGWSIYQSREDNYSMATDSAGNVHLVVVGKTAPETTALSLLHFTWNGSAWSQPDIIQTYMGDAPEWPRIAVSLGNQLNVAWTLRDAQHIGDYENGKYKVFFSRVVIDAPAIAPVAVPDAALSLTKVAATPTASSIATAPAPTQPAGAQTMTPGVDRRGDYTNLDYALIIIGSLLPALIIIGLAIFLFRARYR